MFLTFWKVCCHFGPNISKLHFMTRVIPFSKTFGRVNDLELSVSDLIGLYLWMALNIDEHIGNNQSVCKRICVYRLCIYILLTISLDSIKDLIL